VDPRAVVPNDRIVFVCAKGGRSATAAKLAEDIGRAQVFSLEGGTMAWSAAGLPLETPARPGADPTGTPERASRQPAEAPPADPEAPMLDALISVNLRERRTAQGYTLDELAREAGVSRALLGQIENGRTVPSIGIVWKLAQTLGVPFASLLSSEPNAGTTVTQRARARRLLSADGRFSSRALFALGDPDAAEFYELWLAPHSREDADAHRPGTRENLIVTAGRLELHIGRETRQLEAGDSVVFGADIPHSYVNPGGEECWMYLVMNYRKR
jgi:transcriptional regulator with XRE-family HTH domain